jgi:hypothetical protein
MSFGLRVTSQAGDWIINEAGPALHFLGAATLLGVEGDGVVSETLTRYRIASSTVPLPLLRLNVGQAGAVAGVVSAGGGNYDILVAGGAAAVLCFGPLGSAAPVSSWGLRVFDTAGNVQFDTTRLPLWFSELFDVAGSSAASPNVAALPSAITLAQSYSSPAIAALAAGSHFFSQGFIGNPGTITVDVRRFGWQRTSSGYIPVWIYTSSGAYEATTVNYTHHCSGVAAHTTFVAETAGL